MKNLFLCSHFSSLVKLFQTYSGRELKGKTVTFIPSASNCGKVTFFVDDARKTFAKPGMTLDELDIEKAPREGIQKKLHSNDFIYVSGGNTFYLLQQMRNSGAIELIHELIDSGKPYIGESAGSMIVSPDIEYAKDMDDHTLASELTDFKALCAVDFYPLPHHTNFPFKKAVETILSKFENTLNLYPISNKQAITVLGEHVQVLTK